MSPPTTRNTLHFPQSSRYFLEPHLPPSTPQGDSPYPFTTLTFATSLDSSLSLAPGTQTALSGTETKALTHYLRSRHDAILIGVGTAIADNPSLNCRLEGVGGYGGEGLEGQPRPVIVDPCLKWNFLQRSGEPDGSIVQEPEKKLMKLVREGRGKAPWIVTSVPLSERKSESYEIERLGGKFIYVKEIEGVKKGTMDWKEILATLAAEGIKSTMIEGGGSVINALLQPRYFDVIDSIIVTIAPVWLGQGGVVVSPERRVDEDGHAMAALRLKEVQWEQLGEDVVMCGKVKD